MIRRNRPTELTDAPVIRAIPMDRVDVQNGSGENDLILEGYASTFERYEMYGGPANGGWIEQLDKRAFDKTLKEKPDLHLLINHDGMPLARTKSGNLDLSVDDHGLKVVARLDKRDPEVQSLAIKMERGDMDEMSFAFRVKAQTWESTPEFRDDPEALRTITEVSLHKGDVSVVNWGANPTTHAEVLSAPDLLRALVECDLAEVRGDSDLVKRALEKLGGPAVRIENLVVNEAEDARSVDGPTGTPQDGLVPGLVEMINGLQVRAEARDMTSANEAIAALDAVIDQACELTCNVDRESLDPAVGQALDLISGADALVDQLMEAMGICDPDDMDDSDERSDNEPYGDVDYADPGYIDGKKRYPIDTKEHVKAAWSYINQKKNADQYTAEQLAHIKDKIKAAAKKFGIDIESDEKSLTECVNILCEGMDRPAIVLVYTEEARDEDGVTLHWDKDQVRGIRSLLADIEDSYEKKKGMSKRLMELLNDI